MRRCRVSTNRCERRMPSVVAYRFFGVKLAVTSQIQCLIVLSLSPCPTKLSLFPAIHLQRSHSEWSDDAGVFDMRDSDDDWLPSMDGKQREVCFPLLAPGVFHVSPTIVADAVELVLPVFLLPRRLGVCLQRVLARRGEVP